MVVTLQCDEIARLLSGSGQEAKSYGVTALDENWIKVDPESPRVGHVHCRPHVDDSYPGCLLLQLSVRLWRVPVSSVLSSRNKLLQTLQSKCGTCSSITEDNRLCLNPARLPQVLGSLRVVQVNIGENALQLDLTLGDGEAPDEASSSHAERKEK